MPTYGEWQEGRTHVEIIHGKDTLDSDPPVVHELLSPEPTRRSGFDLTWVGWGAQANVTWEHVGGISNPPLPSADNSAAAFLATLGDPVSGGSGWQYRIASTGARNKISVGSPWEAAHGWTMDGQEYRLGYSFINDIGPEYAVPEGFDPFTSEYYTELEPWIVGPDEDARIELVSMTVLGPGNSGGTYGLFSKDAGTVEAPGAHFLTYGPTSVADSEYNQAPFDFDVDNLTSLMEYITDNGLLPDVAGNNDHPAMPRVSWLYIGPTLSDPHFDGVHDISEVGGMPVQFRVEYKFPRWRQVFYADEPVPYRRIRPRQDKRNGATSRARQSSNRTSGTYL